MIGRGPMGVVWQQNTQNSRHGTFSIETKDTKALDSKSID